MSRTAAKSRELRKPQTRPQKPWHVCEDFFDPLSKYFFELHARWHSPANKDHPGLLDQQYDHVKLGFSIEFLKIWVSVDYANELAVLLEEVRATWRALHRDAMRELHRLNESTVWFQSGNVVRSLIHKFLTNLRVNDPEFDGDWDTDPTLKRYADAYHVLGERIRAAARRLNCASLILRARLDNRGPWSGEVRATANDQAWSKVNTPTYFAKRFGVHRDTFQKWIEEGAILGKKLGDKAYIVALSEIPKSE